MFKNIKLYFFAGIEIVGIWLLSQHRYMGFREDIFAIMVIAAIAFLICETCIHIFKINTNCEITIESLENKDIEKETDSDNEQIL